MDREIRILHTADTHLGYKQYHSEARRKDFFAAFEIVIKDALDMQVAAVVHAGDLFDSRNPTLEDLLETINILSRLKAASIPFYGIVGNHESKQNTQWLDLLQEMKLAARLGKKPQLVGDIAIYGIDSVPRSKIPLFDYSGFEAPGASGPENCRTLLVMHQIVQPFPYAEWDCSELLEKLPFKVDAVLLGDYHKYEKFKVGETWVTYPGSTERNSMSESEPRSYNIITLSDEGLEISKRTIPTRYFLSIPVALNGDEKPYEQIFSAVDEHIEELPASVTLLEISGDSRAVLSFSEIEDYMLKKGVLLAKVVDQRREESFTGETPTVIFSDPDQAVANEIKQMSLNDGGLIIDEIVRNPNVPRSRVDEETEGRLSKLIEIIDFKDPDFRIKLSAKVSASTDRLIDSHEPRPGNEVKLYEEIRPAVKKEFTRKTELVEVITGNSEISRVSERSENSDITNLELIALIPGSPLSAPEPKLIFELVDESVSENSFRSLSRSKPEPELLPKSMLVSEYISEPIIEPKSEPALSESEPSSPESELSSPESEPSSPVSELASKPVSEPMPESASEPVSEIALELAVHKPTIQQETTDTPEKSPVNKTRSRKRDENKSKKGDVPEKNNAIKENYQPGKDDVPEKYNEHEDVTVSLPELRTETSSEVDGDRTEESAQGKTVKASGTAGKASKKEQKKSKSKSVVPRQYNLGDYL